ncbi:Stealth CR1 domain-containing protein [Tenacibaculum ovolyticum]|uniref:Stealth CR1 domain-containing protein n=1 Tax=Tenacibaculum ovolyticum TaxID=104270 RepID=UPI003BA9FDA5
MEIDVVFMWVDGSDPEHKKKMNNYLSVKKDLTKKEIQSRYNQVDEIEFAVKSVIKNADFVRSIFILTDNQVPKFLLDREQRNNLYKKVKMIDHTDVFKGYEEHLPTFNSRAIASVLYKIPDLSENFICMCDDFFLINKTFPDDYFKNNVPRLRGEWKSFDENILHKKVYRSFLKLIGKPKKENFAGHFKAQQIIAKKLGFNKYYKLHHVPMPMRKSTFKKYFEENPNEFINNISHRFRHPSQFLIESLVNHLEIKNDSSELLKDYQLVYIQNFKKPFFWLKYKILKKSKNQNKLFLCLQSLDQAPENKLNFILNWFQLKFK